MNIITRKRIQAFAKTPAPSNQGISKPGDIYMKLIRKFPLRPIRNEGEYDQAAAVLDSLVVRPEGSLETGAEDYMETLTLLIEAYDQQNHPIKPRQLDPRTMLQYLMEQSGMKTADLGRLLGNRGLASRILNGYRGLSKTHIRKLANHFKIDPGLFLMSE